MSSKQKQHKPKTLIIDGNDVIHHPHAQNFKFDDSALKTGRKMISNRYIGEQVPPENMTPKEFHHYLCFKFDLPIGKKWDGIENRHDTYNYSPDKKQKDFKSKEEALKFLGIFNPNAPDNIEKRQRIERRSNQKDTRKIKIERRSAYQRKIDKQNDIKYTIQYVITIIICILIYGILWGIAK